MRLHTVRALQMMDLPLRQIKEVLEYDDLGKIVDFLSRAEQKADEKIAALQYSKSKIQLAKADYEKKLREKQFRSGSFIQEFPARVLLLSDTLETPTLDNLWNYLSHFYDRVPASLKEQFSFEDQAGIYTDGQLTRLFAVCTRYTDIPGLITLPAGKYLCADCTGENREETLQELIQTVKTAYSAEPEFTVQLVVVSGILRWDYQIQVPLGD